ncbi:hypothetical protein [Clostridium sp. CCUG 7971]|uniref:hypothetical protein n=1 Tax=Clostridium sp. CCUG 7971 TaxID=2811414 RepID=UPI001ABA191E|nr:hypothetical protein [Clostridium sp. CCUG 7971]MBO3443411.1 hypothetical protein [Clostridium sp. CCUG 7971]
MTNLNNLAEAISKELKSYSKEVTLGVKKVTDEVTSNLVKNTKRDAKVGRRKGKYKKSISSKVLYENEHKKIKVWYVRSPEYRLAHLLNNGHAKKGGGFIEGDNHITNNEEIAIKELERGIEEVVKNGY